MPGGVAGVRQMIADFHRRGVRVLFPMMMWDQGTHDPGTSWPDAIAATMAEIGADGINGDTQDGVPLAYSLAADKIGHPLVFEPEGGPSDEALAWNVMTWGQYQYPFVPMVDKYKWLETRHMVNISRPLEARQDRQPAIRFLQRRRLGELGKYLGNLERNYSARRGSDAPHRHDRARCRSIPGESRLGADGSHHPLRHLRQPLALGPANSVDDREPQRLRRRGSADRNARRRRDALLRSLSRCGTHTRRESRWQRPY